MKKHILFLFGVLAIVVAGCSKDKDVPTSNPDAWKYDVSLPVPIKFGQTYKVTKGPYIDNLSTETKNFGVFGIDKKAESLSAAGNLLYNAPALYNAEKKMLDLVQTTFYPMTNTRFYNFYAYYTNKHISQVTAEGKKIYVGTNVGEQDILYGSSKVTSVQQATIGCDGYNAKYIRSVHADETIEQADYLPTINFKHVTAALQFYVQTPSASSASVFVENNISIKNIALKNMPISARLCVVDLGSDRYSDDGMSVENSAEGTLEPVSVGYLFVKKASGETTTSTLGIYPAVQPVEAGYPLFIVPQQSAIEGEITMMGYAFDPIPFTLDPSKMADIVTSGEFAAGYKYNIYLTIHSPEKVEIKVTVEAWKDGFLNGDKVNKNDEIELG